MSTVFHVKSPKSVIDRIIRTAGSYADHETGAPAYLKSILLKATEDGRLIVTAESQYSAIQIEQEEGIEVIQPGTMFVRSNWITAALDTVQPDEEVDLSLVTDGKKPKEGEVQVGRVHLNYVDMATPVIGKNAMLPSVGEPDTKNGIKVAPEDFADTYQKASVARTFQSSKPMFQGVLAETAPEEEFLRFMSFDGVATLATDSLDVEIIGEGAGAMIFNDASIRGALDLIKEGNSVEIYRDKEDRVHVIVKGKEGAVPYHIRVATLNYNVADYPVMKLRQYIRRFIDSIAFSMRVEKAELLRVMRNSANIGSLDLNSVGGQAKYVHIQISDGELTSSVTTDASYQETIPAEAEGGVMDAEFHYPFGMTGNLLEVYHNENDEENIQMAILKQPGKNRDIAQAVVLYKDSVYKDDGETPSEYFCVTSVKPVA